MTHRDATELAFFTVQAVLRDFCGLDLAIDKTQGWSPTPEPTLGQLSPFWQPEGIVILDGPMDAPSVQIGLVSADHSPWPRPGGMVFGASPGPCVQGLVDTRSRLMDEAAHLVTLLPSKAPLSYPAAQVALLLLLMYCVAPRADHLLRHLPPAISNAFAPRVDQLLLETFQSSLRARLSATHAEQIQFPLSEGGWFCWRDRVHLPLRHT